jgi:hypothetical protein
MSSINSDDEIQMKSIARESQAKQGKLSSSLAVKTRTVATQTKSCYDTHQKTTGEHPIDRNTVRLAVNWRLKPLLYKQSPPTRTNTRANRTVLQSIGLN